VEVARWDANPRVFFLRFKSAAAGPYQNCFVSPPQRNNYFEHLGLEAS
jgi:hypothetical protein